MMRALVVALVLTSLVPAATAAETQQFFLTDDTLSLLPATSGELRHAVANELGLQVGAIPGVVTQNTALFKMALQEGGNVNLGGLAIWFEATAPVATSPVGSGDFALCPLQIFIGIMSADESTTRGSWYLCAGVGELPVNPGGFFEVTNDMEGLDPIDAKPGDILYVAAWSTSSSIEANPTLFALSDSAEHPSSITLTGTSEVVPGSTSTPTTPTTPTNPTPTSATPTKPTGTTPPTPTATTPPTTAEPEPSPATPSASFPKATPPATDDGKDSPGAPLVGLVVALAVLCALVVRRR